MSLLHLYHRLPPSMQSWAASWHGARLAARRYGPETDELVAAAVEREHWSPRQWAQWRQTRLGEVLVRAAMRVPYYRESLPRRWDELASWPLLEKQRLRERGADFVADDLDHGELWVERTSGTTGTPLKLWRSRRTLRARYALYEARHRGWFGVSRRDRWAMAGGQLVAPRQREQPPFWVWNRPMQQLYVSSYHTAPRQLRASLVEMGRRRCRYLWGYPSTLTALAQAADGIGEKLGLAVIIANAEPVSPRQRRVIESAFGCPLRETYGMVELAAGAGECQHGRLHLFPDMGLYEVLGDDGEVRCYGEGELIATGLLDLDMPLIRYRTGDRVRIELMPEPCPCGRTLPTLASLTGRQDDLLHLPDGRTVGRLDPVFKEDLPVRAAQIVQRALDRVDVLVEPAAGWDTGASDALRAALAERLSGVTIEVRTTEEIPRGANGKFRAVVCEIPVAERPVGRFQAAC